MEKCFNEHRAAGKGRAFVSRRPIRLFNLLLVNSSSVGQMAHVQWPTSEIRHAAQVPAVSLSKISRKLKWPLKENLTKTTIIFCKKK